MKFSKIKQRKSQPKGITLVEVLVTITISSFMILAMLSLYVAGQRYFMNGSARSDVLRDNTVLFFKFPLLIRAVL
jgi:Tfp pilus assembly protein PilW